MGLAKAIKTFKLDKGYKFSSYASRCILNEVFILLRFNKRYQKDISMDKPLKGSDKDDTIRDRMEHPTDNPMEDALYELIGSDMIIEMRANLNVLQKKVFDCMLTGNYKSQQLIANEVGISRSYVSKMVKEIQELGRELYVTH